MGLINVINEITALVAMILIGFVGYKVKAFNQQFSQMISGFVIRITLPLLIIVSMNRKYSNELFQNTILLIGISCVIYICIILLAEIWSHNIKKPHEQSAVLKWLVIFGNCSFMGYPIINALYGSLGVFYAAVFNMFYMILLFSYGVAILQKGFGKTVWKSLRNPGLIATIIGFAFFMLKITLPYVLIRPMQMVGDMTIPLALIITGISLAQIPLGELVQPVDIWITSLIRLILFPSTILWILLQFDLNQYLIVVPVILMGTPAALTAGAFALNYGLNDRLASKGVVLSNLLSIITLPVWVWIVMRAVNS